MKVDPNAPAYPSNPSADVYCNLGIPIRLAIAAQIMAAETAYGGLRVGDFEMNAIDAKCAIQRADALIAAHNEGAE